MQTRIALAALALSAATLAQAGDFGNHPAVENTRAAGIDASQLMYGHPASPLNRGGRANFPHPALAQRSATTIDAAALMYGHPASPLNGAAAENVNVASTR